MLMKNLPFRYSYLRRANANDINGVDIVYSLFGDASYYK